MRRDEFEWCRSGCRPCSALSSGSELDDSGEEAISRVNEEESRSSLSYSGALGLWWFGEAGAGSWAWSKGGDGAGSTWPLLWGGILVSNSFYVGAIDLFKPHAIIRVVVDRVAILSPKFYDMRGIDTDRLVATITELK